MVAERVGLMRWEMRAAMPASELRDWYAHLSLEADRIEKARQG